MRFPSPISHPPSPIRAILPHTDRRRKRLLEGEHVGGRPVCLKLLQPLLGLVDSRNMPGLEPPERHKCTLELLEPLAATAHSSSVCAFVDIGAQIFERFPDRHVHNNKIVVEWAQASGI